MGRRAIQLCLTLCLMLSAGLLCSCDDGLKSVDTQIVSYPDRLVYIKGVDTELDLKGGVYREELKQGNLILCEMDNERTSYSLNKFGNVDFDRKGIYRISFGSQRIGCDFPIQVISLEDYGITQDDIGPGGL